MKTILMYGAINGGQRCLGHREVIATLASLVSTAGGAGATDCASRFKTLPIENERGPFFNPTAQGVPAGTAALNYPDNDGFADMYAPTIAYGLLAARVENPKAKTADALPAQMPVTNPFLKELMATFLHAGGRHGRADSSRINFDELGMSDVVALLDSANMEAVVKDFGDQTATKTQ